MGNTLLKRSVQPLCFNVQGTPYGMEFLGVQPLTSSSYMQLGTNGWKGIVVLTKTETDYRSNRGAARCQRGKDNSG